MIFNDGQVRVITLENINELLPDLLYAPLRAEIIQLFALNNFCWENL